MPLTCIFSEHTCFSTSVPCYKFLPNLQRFYTRKVRGRGHFRTFPLPMQERDPKMTGKNWVETSHGIQQSYGLKLRDLDWTGLDFTWNPKIIVYDLLAQNHLIILHLFQLEVLEFQMIRKLNLKLNPKACIFLCVKIQVK